MTPLLRHDRLRLLRAPLPESWWGGLTAPPDEHQACYCCLGCRIAAAIVDEKGEDGLSRTMLARLGLSVFFTMNVIAFTMALWTTDVYGTDRAARKPGADLQRAFSLSRLDLLGCRFFCYSGCPCSSTPGSGCAKASCRRTGCWPQASPLRLPSRFSPCSAVEEAVYFEVGCVILVMTTLGRWLEATGKRKANAALDALTKLLPDRVRRIRDGQEQMVPSEEIQIDDRVRVLPGERFPVDGRVVRHRGLVDEQVLTGESTAGAQGARRSHSGWHTQPRWRSDDPGRARSARRERSPGWCNWSSWRGNRKGRYQRLADRVSRRFVPAVSAIALLAFGVHWAFGSLEHGLWTGLAVTLDRLSVRPGAGRSSGGVECARQRRGPTGLVPEW